MKMRICRMKAASPTKMACSRKKLRSCEAEKLNQDPG